MTEIPGSELPVIAAVFMALLSALSFVFWQIIDSLRQDVAALTSTVIDLRLAVASLAAMTRTGRSQVHHVAGE